MFGLSLFGTVPFGLSGSTTGGIVQTLTATGSSSTGAVVALSAVRALTVTGSSSTSAVVALTPSAPSVIRALLASIEPTLLEITIEGGTLAANVRGGTITASVRGGTIGVGSVG